MKTVHISNTELFVSRLCMGSSELGSLIPPADAFALLDEFMSLGGNFIDTAHVYANWLPDFQHSSEKIIGKWLKARGGREQLVIATKGGHPDLSTMRVSRLSRAEIVQDLTESLEYLQTDYVDVYWLHRDDSAIPVNEIVDILHEQVQAGRIRYLGASNWTAARIQAANDYAARNSKQQFTANQPLWSLAVPNMKSHPDQTVVAMDGGMLEYHRRTGMAAIPYSSQAHGFFTKLDRSGRETIPTADLVIFDNERNLKRLKRVRQLARRHAVAINDVVLAYLICQPFPVIPIIGSKRPEHLYSSVRALELSFTPDELAFLEAG